MGRKALGEFAGLDGEGDVEEYPDWGPVFLSAASKAILLNWYRKAQIIRQGKRGKKRDKIIKEVSDDEGEDMPAHWAQQASGLSAATIAIALKWSRSARAQLQKKKGKGSGMRESNITNDDEEKEERFKSGQK
eukprot:gene60650-80879_t